MTLASDLTSSNHRHSTDEVVLRPAPYHRWKGVIGRILAAAMLVAGLPIIGILVILVRLTSRGPGIYRQVRVGLNGHTFAMYKIRTMRVDAEVKSGPAWTQKNDPRVTTLGRILRKLHLDEFPQLFNVLRGEMALIGPRPERPEFTQVLAREIPGYMDRILILPGITGLAQINLPPDTDLDSVRRKLVLDLEYVRTASPLLDVRMIACTLLRMLGMRGDYAMRLMGLQRCVTLESEKPAVECDAHATPSSIVAQNQAPAASTAPPTSNGHRAEEGVAAEVLDKPISNKAIFSGVTAAAASLVEAKRRNSSVAVFSANDERLGIN